MDCQADFWPYEVI